MIVGLLYVLLAARENAWCWPFGIIGSAAYIYINYEATLFLDAWLQVYYCVIGAYGWFVWLRGRESKNNGAHLHRASATIVIACIVLPIALTFPLGWLMHQYTTSKAPYMDALLTLGSFVATWMTTRKMLQNWIFWIVIDAAYIFLYVNRGYPLTAILFLIYTIVAAYGYLQWKKHLRPSGV